MNKPKVYATHCLFEPARKLLEAHCEVDYCRGPARPPRATLLEYVVGKDALICLLTEKINDGLLDTGSKLKIVANVAVGFDNIDVPACTRHISHPPAWRRARKWRSWRCIMFSPCSTAASRRTR
jgi:glyoxylate reductase